MCYRCDYTSLLEKGRLDYTPHRFRVMEIIGNSSSPLSAKEIHEKLSQTGGVNRVTVYRILDLFVEKKLVERIRSGDRSSHYGLAPNQNHPRHAHFYCTACGSIECLRPGSLHLNIESLERTFPGLIRRAEIRLDGVCKTCIKSEESQS